MKQAIKSLVLAAFALLSLHTVADTISPLHYHRYHRIGYEILPDAGSIMDAGSIIREYIPSVLWIVVLGFGICFCLRKDWRTKVLRGARQFLSFAFWVIVKMLSFVGVLVGVGVTLGGFIAFLACQQWTLNEWDLLMILGSVVLLFLGIVLFLKVVFRKKLRAFKERQEKRFPMLYKKNTAYCAVLILVCFALFFTLYFLSSVGMLDYSRLLNKQVVVKQVACSDDALYNNAEMAEARGEPYFDPAPGWKYPTELTGKECADFYAKLGALPSRMSEKIKAEWEKDSTDGSEDHAQAVVIAVLKGDCRLRWACLGISVEWIVAHYFTKKEWYEMGRRHFMHPRNVPFVKPIIDIM